MRGDRIPALISALAEKLNVVHAALAPAQSTTGFADPKEARGVRMTRAMLLRGFGIRHYRYMSAHDGIGSTSLKRLQSAQRRLKKARTDEERAEAAGEIAAALAASKTAWQEELDREPKSVEDLPTGIRGQSKRS